MAFSLNPNAPQQCCNSLQNLFDMLSANGRLGVGVPQLSQMPSMATNNIQYPTTMMQPPMCPMGILPQQTVQNMQQHHFTGGTIQVQGLQPRPPMMNTGHPGFTHTAPQLQSTSSFTPMHQMQSLQSFNTMPGIQNLPCVQQNPRFDLRNCPMVQRREEIRQTPNLPIPRKKKVIKEVIPKVVITPSKQVLPGTPILPVGRPLNVVAELIDLSIPAQQSLPSSVSGEKSAFKIPRAKTPQEKMKEPQMLPPAASKTPEVTVIPRKISKPSPPPKVKDEEEDDPNDGFVMGQIKPNPYFPTHFMKGTMYNLAGTQKKVEDLNSDDFLKCVRYTKEFYVEVAPVREIVSTKDAARIKFVVGFPKPYETWLEVRIEYPFYVVGKGWTSVDPIRTRGTYGLDAHPLVLNDICITLTRKSERNQARQLDMVVSLAEAQKFREKQHEQAVWRASIGRQLDQKEEKSGRTSVPPGSTHEATNSRKRRASEAF